jgi:hypothetical protein
MCGIAAPRNFLSRASGIRMHMQLNAQRLKTFFTLWQRVNMTVNMFQSADIRTLNAQQTMADRLKMLTYNEQITVGHQMVNIRNAPRNRVINGNHRQIGITILHSRERIIK